MPAGLQQQALTCQGASPLVRLQPCSSFGSARVLTQVSATDVDRQASGLVKAASSLLLLQPALQGTVAQAFLLLLTYIAQRKRQGLAEAYGCAYSPNIHLWWPPREAWAEALHACSAAGHSIGS